MYGKDCISHHYLLKMFHFLLVVGLVCSVHSRRVRTTKVCTWPRPYKAFDIEFIDTAVLQYCNFVAYVLHWRIFLPWSLKPELSIEGDYTRILLVFNHPVDCLVQAVYFCSGQNSKLWTMGQECQSSKEIIMI